METFAGKKFINTVQAILRHEILFHRTAVETVNLVPRLMKKSVIQHYLIIISMVMLVYRYLIWLLFLNIFKFGR